MRDDATRTVQHGCEDAALYGRHRQQALLLLAHLIQHLRTVPLIEGRPEVVLALTETPPHALSAHGVADDVGLAGSESVDHIHRIATDLHAESHAQMVGKALTQQILHTQVSPTIVVVRLGARQREANQFAVILDVVRS